MPHSLVNRFDYTVEDALYPLEMGIGVAILLCACGNVEDERRCIKRESPVVRDIRIQRKWTPHLTRISR